MNVTDRGRT